MNYYCAEFVQILKLPAGKIDVLFDNTHYQYKLVVVTRA